MKTSRHFLQRLLPFQGLRSLIGVLAIEGDALAVNPHLACLGRPCAAAQDWEDSIYPGKGSA